MSSFNDLVQDIINWQSETFTESTIMSKLHHLDQEIDELIIAIENSEDMEAIDMELADCFLLLIGAAGKNGLDGDGIQDIIRQKLEVNKKRKWDKPDANGVVNHIE